MDEMHAKGQEGRKLTVIEEHKARRGPINSNNDRDATATATAIMRS